MTITKDGWQVLSYAFFAIFQFSLRSFFSAIYISLVSFHQGLLPAELAITIAATREDVPFSPFIEAMVMEVTIELLREAGLRLPTPVGQTVGLVGGVVIVVGSLLPKTAGDVIAFADLLSWAFLIIFLAVPFFLGSIMLIKKRVRRI
ncbi:MULTISPECIES: spore germination protein [Bacillaceae]|uniref:spore germination protein n=1 Tax=Bacillus sp. VT 712 TaxID=1848047 RepID=UPI002166026E|nr:MULTISPECIES: spore germination protein [Bacillaceae]